jgi:hypothetical protein
MVHTYLSVCIRIQAFHITLGIVPLETRGIQRIHETQFAERNKFSNK